MNEFLNKIIEELESLVDDSGQFKKFYNSDSAPLSILSIADVIKSKLRTEEEHQERQMLQSEPGGIGGIGGRQMFQSEPGGIGGDKFSETSIPLHLRNCAS